MRYFDMEEFSSPDEIGSYSNMSEDFLSMIENARHIAKTSFVITSGFRTKSHNLRINGNTFSSHLKGLAADIACDNGPKRIKIISGLILAGFKRIGIAKTFIHADTDGNKPNSIWLY